MKPFFIFRFFPFFRQIAKRKVLVFCSQCFAYYTTTRENRELRQCDYIEEINFHHIVILAAAGSCAREGHIEHKKRKHRHSSEHGGKSLHRLHPKHHSALMFPFIIFYHRRAASRHPEVLILDLTFSLLFSFFCLWRWRFMV